MSPLEKMARAIDPDAWVATDNSTWSQAQKLKSLRKARAALLAIREPDDGMFEAYSDAADDTDGPACLYLQTAAYRAMIDHILNQEPRP